MANSFILARLAALAGIEPGYLDAWNQPHETAEAVIRRVLETMGLPAADDHAAEASLRHLEGRQWRRMLPPALVLVRDQQAPRIPLALPAAAQFEEWRWELEEEEGKTHRGRFRFGDLALIETGLHDGETHERRELVLPVTPPIGYHRLRLRGPAKTVSTVLIAAPARAWLPPCLREGSRLWGLAAPLYALRSNHNWGIGDLTDLGYLAEQAAKKGAAMVAINPLHALFLDDPQHSAPYSPSSRLFLNPLYLDVEAVADFAECRQAQAMVAEPEFIDGIAALRRARLVDYPEVAARKLAVLEVLYEWFHANHLDAAGEALSARARAFQRFRREAGRALTDFATFQALREFFSARSPEMRSWRNWPTSYQDPRGPAIARFVSRHRHRVTWFEYLQWLAEQQLTDAAARCQRSGMPIGLFGDLAVGTDAGGAEAWTMQSALALDASVGAPPDLLNPQGQVWGLPPFSPLALEEAGFAPFIAVLRANMRHAAALRIDHAMGLTRLYWVPNGNAPAEGAYVRYPFDALLGIVALESHRAHCLVVGEDLGTVPEGFSQRLNAADIHSYRLLLFEQEEDGAFKPPESYPPVSLVAVTTHDLPTIRGFWQARDLSQREKLGLFPSPQLLADALTTRERDRDSLLRALARDGLGFVPEEDGPEIVAHLALNLHRFLARSPARLMLVQLDDVWQVPEQANMPGTTDQYPNWRRKLEIPLEELETDAAMRELAEAMTAEGRRASARVAEEGVAEPPDARWKPPLATYRLQFSKDFTFQQARRILPYLRDLGITHLYASPFLKARAGSTHGYDIIDHNSLNPEIGSEAELNELAVALKRLGMGMIMDFVPNHMGVGGSQNQWWMDVLEWGPASSYASYFDIDWQPIRRDLHRKVLLPFLGDHYGLVLERGELKLAFDATRGAFSVTYYDRRFPVAPHEYARILTVRIAQLRAHDQQLAGEITALAALFRPLGGVASASSERRASQHALSLELKDKLAGLVKRLPAMAQYIHQTVEWYNGTPDEPDSFVPLHRLLENQSYRLAYWRVAADDINYRRFFDINDLAGLQIEAFDLFETAHRLVFRLLTEDKLTGLRIDHVDGLFDPAQYCERLQRRAPRKGSWPFFVVVEKILAPHEQVRPDWQIAGTTGYEFANIVNGLLMDSEAESRFDRIWRRFTSTARDFDNVLVESKRRIIDGNLASELTVLATELSRISGSHWRTRDFTYNSLREALREVVAQFPVYRTYITARRVTDEDRRYIEWAIGKTRRRFGPEPSLLDFLQQVLTTDLVRRARPDYARRAVIRFAMRVQQYTAPVMAKGLEDTAFYRYPRLISLNEVGGDPRRFGVSVSQFHRFNRDRAKRWPFCMLSTSTHDSKRGEDARVRIGVLTEMPNEWSLRLRRWLRLNESRHRQLDDGIAPGPTDEYLFYQTLVGAWPTELMTTPPPDELLPPFRERMIQAMTKAVREAKLRTSWANPNLPYEEALSHFIERVLATDHANPFLLDFRPFAQRVARYGVFSSLSQVVLKLTAPGIPDFYQGTELWDLNLVDPDNRRPVDYTSRVRTLDTLRHAFGSRFEPNRHAEAETATDLLATWKDGRIKMFLTWRLLQLRAALPDLFRGGTYRPLETFGSTAGHLCAFSRRRAGTTMVVAVPRLTCMLATEEELMPLGTTWADGRIASPLNRRTRFRDAITGISLRSEEEEGRHVLPAAALFERLPVAVLVAG